MGKAFKGSRPSLRWGGGSLEVESARVWPGLPGGGPRAPGLPTLASRGHAEGPHPASPPRSLPQRSPAPRPCPYLPACVPEPPRTARPARRCAGSPAPRPPGAPAAPTAQPGPARTSPRRPVIGCQESAARRNAHLIGSKGPWERFPTRAPLVTAAGGGAQQ